MKKIYKNFLLLLPVIFLMTPVFSFAQSNQYLHFDMVDDYVILDEGGQYVSGTSELSIAGWFKCDQLAYGQGYMGFRAGSGNGEFYLIQLSDGVMECRLVTTAGFHEYVSPANTAIPQVWQHFAWVYDGSAITLYVNGAFIGSSPASGQFSNPTVSFAVGKSIVGTFNFVYGGGVDEVSVWDKALTLTEIQDMINNELTGSEDNLQMYYKFNQGEPAGNNTSITQLICEIGTGERDADLMNFALTGATSNFLGTLDPGYQAISFPQIPNHLTTDPPFQLEATATSGLPVQFEVLSGPATLDTTLLTLTGEAGTVVIEATQPGNATYNPADPVVNTFLVIDPSTHLPEIDPRCPLTGDVYVPELGFIQLAAIATIEYPELFWVSDVQFSINGDVLYPTAWGDGYYSGWWEVPEYGSYTLTISAKNNYGYTATETVPINVISDVTFMQVQAVDDVWLNPSVPFEVVDAELPSYMGAFDEIIGILEVTCPPGGCGEWDRVASIDARGHDGKWVEIIRYITPYGVPCSSTIDLTDYMSILQGKVSFRVNCGTLDNGYLWDLTLNFNEGAPEFNYSHIDIIWWETYQFGDYANLQPVEDVDFTFPENTLASTLKLVSSGHGWDGGQGLNTGNAAEFYEATHHIWVNNTETFEQHNWYDCNPNPDGCQPQNGTWFHNRAGWCPGAIAQWFDYDLTSFIPQDDLELGYIFYENYVDLCHPNHPSCVTGVTCVDCDAGFNPHLIVACNLVVFSDTPIDSGAVVSVDKHFQDIGRYIQLYPNPSDGTMTLSFHGNGDFGRADVEIVDLTGKLCDQFIWHGETTTLNLTHLQRGVYFFKIQTKDSIEVRKIVIQ